MVKWLLLLTTLVLCLFCKIKGECDEKLMMDLLRNMQNCIYEKDPMKLTEFSKQALEFCSTGNRSFIEYCYNLEVEQKTNNCTTPNQAKVVQSYVDLNSGRNMLACKNEGKLYMSFHEQNGSRCYYNVKIDALRNEKCDLKLPAPLSSFTEKAVCNKYKDYFLCLQKTINRQLDSLCSSFVKRFIYTYFKYGILNTSCRSHISQLNLNDEDMLLLKEPKQEAADKKTTSKNNVKEQHQHERSLNNDNSSQASVTTPFWMLILFVITQLKLLL